MLKAVKRADLNEHDWPYLVLVRCVDMYAKGYLTAHVQLLGDSIHCSTQEFRNLFLSRCDHDIWGKQPQVK